MLNRKQVVCAFAQVFGGLAVCALAPVALAQQQQQDTQKLERVEITGSSIKRIEGETALPVTVITREEIAKSGVATVEELLSRVASISSSGTQNLATGSGATTGGQSTASLRGLGGDRTLILINGRRVANFAGPAGSASVDINAIPFAAIERVEVLRDGASAVYGSDAVAGVINFILRKDFTGVELGAYYGDSSDGGGGTQKVQVLTGFGDIGADRYNLMLIAGAERQQALFGRQRSFSSTSISPRIPLVETTSGNTFPANIFIPVYGFDPVTGRYSGAPAVPDPVGDPVTIDGRTRNPLVASSCAPGVLSSNTAAFGTNQCRFDPAGLVSLIPKAERFTVNAFGRMDIGSGTELYADLGFVRNKVNTVIQPVPLSDQFSLPDNNPLVSQFPYNINTAGAPGGRTTILLFPTSAFYPTTYVQGLLSDPAARGSLAGLRNFYGAVPDGVLPPLFVRYRAVENGNRSTQDTNDQYTANFGVKGVVAGWDYSAGVQLAQSKVTEETLDGYPLYSRILPLLNSGTVNFFGPNTPTVSAQLRATNYRGVVFDNEAGFSSVSAKASRELFALPGGPAALAVGVDFRRESYKLAPSQVWQQGDISGYGGQALPVDRSRNVSAAYAELAAPLLKTLEATAAVRYDRYDTVGATTNPKLGLRWTPRAGLLVRGSVGTGFRAPSLYDLYQPQTLGVTEVLSDPQRCATTNSPSDCATQFALITGGNPNTKPEKSDSRTLGVLLEPTRNLSVGADLFWLELKNLITTIGADTILNNEAQFPGAVIRGAGSATLPGPIQRIVSVTRNLGKVKMSGVDLDGRYRFGSSDTGRFTVALNGTYYNKYDVQNLDGSFSNTVDQAGGVTGGFVSRWRHAASVNWERAAWSVTIAQNFQKAYTETYQTLFGDVISRPVEAYETFDAQVAWTGIKNLRLALGARNLMNRNPPYVAGNTSFQSGYDISYADPRGRFVYLTANYSFK